ncbi:MAG: ATP-binding protein [Sulfurimicrobium sp.]
MRRHSLFRSTAATLALALLVFQAITLSVTVFFVMQPMAKRSAEDLAALIVLSAQTWVELPPQTRPDFELELARKDNLWLFQATTPLPGHHHVFMPYLFMLESALEKRLGQPIEIKITQWEQTWFWVEIHTGGKLIRIGFPREHLGVNPSAALLLVLSTTIALILLSSVILARRISRPLAKLSAAAERIGQGNTPETLPETGPDELASLASAFNRMALQVQELLSNRTTLLAGISHDLRTPLARMRLAVEMLPQDADPKLIGRLLHDLEEMNRLIGEFIELSRGLEKEAARETDLTRLLQELVNDARNGGAQVEWQGQEPCMRLAGAMALRRILANLIGNAVRYGAGQPVTIECACGQGPVVIRVLDRGQGIPPDKMESVFRPFFRLESSRSSATGGSGLGLAIARQLADANGWKIELLPRQGGGTEARLTLP